MANSLLSDLRTKLNDKIAASATNGFFSQAQKDATINTGGERTCNYRKWKSLESAKTTVSVANQEYYDAPAQFQDDSVYSIYVDGEEYIKKDWDDFQDYRNNESDEKVFATHDGLIFINPIPDEDNLDVDMWGLLAWVKLSDAADESILPPKFDEAIIELAFAECQQKKGKIAAAIATRKQVEDPANPQVQGSGGLLARIGEREDDGGKSGSVGKATCTRFMQ